MAQVPVALLDANVQADINPAPKQQDPQKIVQPAAQLAAQPVRTTTTARPISTARVKRFDLV